MTRERRKSILILTGTLIIGILIGLLAPGLFYKMKRRTADTTYHGDSRALDRKSNWFAETINRIVQPDSAQSQEVLAITKKAAAQIDSIESHANFQMSTVLDSVKIRLKPMLNDEQLQRLQDFDARAKSNWHGGRRGGHKH